MRTGSELKAALGSLRPPSGGIRDPEDPVASGTNVPEAGQGDNSADSYRKPPAPDPRPSKKKPMFITGLAPRARGYRGVPLGGEGNPPLGVEWKVGRGRVTDAPPVSLSDPDLIAWPKVTTQWSAESCSDAPRRSKLNPLAQDPNTGSRSSRPFTSRSTGNDLTTVRYLSRDLGSSDQAKTVDEDGLGRISNSMGLQSENSIDPVLERGPPRRVARLGGLAHPEPGRAEKPRASEIPSPGRGLRPESDPGVHPGPRAAQLPDLPLFARPSGVGLGGGARPISLAFAIRGRAGGGLRRRIRLLLRRDRPDRRPTAITRGAISASSPRSIRPAGSSSAHLHAPTHFGSSTSNRQLLGARTTSQAGPWRILALVAGVSREQHVPGRAGWPAPGTVNLAQ